MVLFSDICFITRFCVWVCALDFYLSLYVGPRGVREPGLGSRVGRLGSHPVLPEPRWGPVQVLSPWVISSLLTLEKSRAAGGEPAQSCCIGEHLGVQVRDGGDPWLWGRPWKWLRRSLP